LVEENRINVSLLTKTVSTTNLEKEASGHDIIGFDILDKRFRGISVFGADAYLMNGLECKKEKPAVTVKQIIRRMSL
jgi:hypothetical protein